MSDAVIRAEHLSRRFGALTALDDLTLTVPRGESWAVFGPNGAGKTTLLRLCGTLLRPTGGRIHLFGADLSRGHAAVRGRVGVLSHQSFLYPDLTPTENLLFYARMFGVAGAPHRVAEMIERVGLTGWAHQPVRTLSRGLEQRCALARALLHQPDLLLLDEPFTGLDLDAVETIDALLHEERARGVTVLLTTHDLGRGFALCDRALVLVRGKIQWQGSIAPDDRANFEAVYADTVRASRRRGPRRIARKARREEPAP